MYEPVTLYRKANTPAQRALVGYIIKAGLVDDPIFGGAFSVLRGIEKCMQNEEIYELYNCVDNETKRKILHVAQLALDGKFDRFAISERERNDILKNLCQPI
jgi:hypothetical protein